MDLAEQKLLSILKRLGGYNIMKNWKKEFNKQFGFGDKKVKKTYMDFIQQELDNQKKEIIERIKKMRLNGRDILYSKSEILHGFESAYNQALFEVIQTIKEES